MKRNIGPYVYCIGCNERLEVDYTEDCEDEWGRYMCTEVYVEACPRCTKTLKLQYARDLLNGALADLADEDIENAVDLITAALTQIEEE